LKNWDSALEAFINFTPKREIPYYTNATRKADSWSVLLKVPMEMICNIFSIEPLKTGDSFTCNFYKICESKNLEHYASYAPIVSDRRNFHLPQFSRLRLLWGDSKQKKHRER
jgi:hypothetical protein